MNNQAAFCFLASFCFLSPNAGNQQRPTVQLKLTDLTKFVRF